MLRLLKQWFNQEPDPIIEGPMADQYPLETQDVIRQEYRQRWHPEYQLPTPLSHPWLFDPCEPPKGWKYDPFYECWINYD